MGLIAIALGLFFLLAQKSISPWVPSDLIYLEAHDLALILMFIGGWLWMCVRCPRCHRYFLLNRTNGVPALQSGCGNCGLIRNSISGGDQSGHKLDS
jgi:hypothetical protein